MCGVYLNKAFLLCFIIFVPVTLIMLNIESLLILVHQEPKMSKYCGHLLFYQLPAVYM
jgi:hypothetical protein